MKKSFLTFISLVAVVNLFTFALAPAFSLAAEDDFRKEIGTQLEPIGDVYGYDSGDVDNTTLAKTVASVIKVILGFLGVVFLVLILYAGFLWMTAAGSEEKVTKAKNIMVAAIIGVAIVLAAYAITFFVIDNLVMATTGRDMGID
jgi:preprotein translocase subunit SecG